MDREVPEGLVMLPLEIDTKVFDRVLTRCNALGCTVDDYIEQALVYAMANEDPENGKTEA